MRRALMIAIAVALTSCGSAGSDSDCDIQRFAIRGQGIERGTVIVEVKVCTETEHPTSFQEAWDCRCDSCCHWLDHYYGVEDHGDAYWAHD